MSMGTPQQASDKLKRAIQNSQIAYQEGVARVTESPMQKAVDNGEKYIANVTKAYQEGKWAKRLLDVTLADWKNITSTTGSQRYVAGADKAAKNYLAFATKFFPFVKQVQDEIKAMPSVTLEDNIARMTHNVRRLATYNL